MKMPPPTREQQQMAYRHLARPGWPPTLDDALQQYSYATAINGLARRLGRPGFAQRTGPSHRLPRPPVPPTPAADASVQRGRAHGVAKPNLLPFTGLPAPLGSFARTANGPGWMGSTATVAPGAADRKRLAANDIDD